ncbi:MAG: ATP-binding protein [Deltaproteobacteria bacterium]|nr:ATP-binding protein [Deltaproteobacteria bacterium]
MFTQATKKQARLRLALTGPAGSGKTWTALAIATGLGGRIAVVDTERGSASKYADLFRFDTTELENFHPQKYIDAIAEAERADYDVLILDSLSHEWSGKGGALELVDAAARRSKSGSTFNAWRDVTPLQQALMDAILRSRCHVIFTMRSKVEYVLEDRDGKKVPRKVGLAPVQRDGVEYEADVIGELDLENVLTITKSRCPALTGQVISKPGAALGKTLAAWLSDGVQTPVVATSTPPPPQPDDDPVEEVMSAIERAKTNTDLGAVWRRIEQLSPAQKGAVKDAYVAKRRTLTNGSGVHHV